MKRGLLLVVCLLMGMGSLWAYDFSAVNSDGKTIYYNITDATNHEVEVALYPDTNSRYSGVINIPASVVNNGTTYSVTGIYKGSESYNDSYGGAFALCSNLTSVTIPNTITEIGCYVFYGCTSLTSITIPNSVTKIGYGAFCRCSVLNSVTLGNSVDTIGDNAFNGTAITNIAIPNSVRYLSGFGSTNLNSVTIPNSVTTIGDNAFSYCSGLATVIMGNSVTTIGNNAFDNCGGITTLTLSNTLRTIGRCAFAHCINLPSLTIPDSVTTIGEYAFFSCNGLTSVTIGKSVTEIELGAFSNCSNLTSITIGKSVTEIGENVLSSCSMLQQIIVKAVTPPTVHSHAFYNVSYTVPVYVPCGSLSAYQNNVSWSYFMYIQCRVNMYGITVISNNNVWGTVDGGGEYEEGDTATLTATANEGYRFVSWNDGNIENPRMVTVTDDVTYIATFEAIPTTEQYTVTVMSNNDAWGVVTGGGEYEEGAMVTLTATANEGYRFVSWNDGNTNNPRTITVTADATYIATFEAIPTTEHYTITVMSSNDDFGTVTGGGEYEEGESVIISAMANDGYRFVNWNDDNTDNPRRVVVSEDATYIAIFTKDNPEGIEDVDGMAGVKVYPNPTSGMIRVEGVGVERVEVLNMVGVKVLECEGVERIDLSGLVNGVYVLRIGTDEGVVVRRVVKR